MKCLLNYNVRLWMLKTNDFINTSVYPFKVTFVLFFIK